MATNRIDVAGRFAAMSFIIFVIAASFSARIALHLHWQSFVRPDGLMRERANNQRRRGEAPEAARPKIAIAGWFEKLKHCHRSLCFQTVCLKRLMQSNFAWVVTRGGGSIPSTTGILGRFTNT